MEKNVHREENELELIASYIFAFKYLQPSSAQKVRTTQYKVHLQLNKSLSAFVI